MIQSPNSDFKERFGSVASVSLVRGARVNCQKFSWSFVRQGFLLESRDTHRVSSGWYGQASGVPSPPPPNGMVWYGVGGGGGLACAERGGGRWSCSWRNGQASQTRPAKYANPTLAINPIM